MGELVFNAVLFLFMVAMTVYSGSIEIWDKYWGARYYPMIILLLIDGLLLYKTIKILKALQKDEKKIDISVFKQKGVIRLLVAFAATFVFVFTLEKLGFVLGVFLYGMVLCYLLGCRKLWLIPLISLAVTIAIYAIFAWGLEIMLPRGTGVLYYFGLWLETLV